MCLMKLSVIKASPKWHQANMTWSDVPHKMLALCFIEKGDWNSVLKSKGLGILCTNI